jgi:hypothetical protein
MTDAIEQRVWICQCLCPGRHCILASVAEAPDEATASERVRTPLRRAVVDLLAAGELNPVCAICGANSATWNYELGRTAFATLAEAMPTLRAIEAANVASNAAWRDLPKTKPN